MNSNFGDIDPGDIIDYGVTSKDVTTRAPATMTGSPTLRAYKDNSGTGSTAGITFTRDFQAIVGHNHLRVDTSFDSAFYSTGSNFKVLFEAGLVGSVSVVGEVALYFSIGKRSALRPHTAGRKIQVNPNGFVGPDWGNLVNATASVSLSNTRIGTAGSVQNLQLNPQGYAGIDWGNITNKTASAQLSATLIDTVNYARVDWAMMYNPTASVNLSNTIIATVSSLVGLSAAQVFNATIGSGSENGQNYGQLLRGIYAAVAGRSRRSTNSITFYGHDNTTSRLIMEFNGNSDRSSVTATLG